ncbi:MAG: glycosyltransferase family 2 protein [Desulfobulbaceae bacterium]|nr:glycosyltransferase family 2 protein [Desulfobulbaceae bacterium]
MKISIITPCLNAAPFIERTLLSVLEQCGDFELEYFIVDGVSTDGTVEIIRRYENRLHLVSEKDPGQASAINKGLKLATGDVVAFLNADDCYAPGALAAVAAVFEDPHVHWAFGKCDIVDTHDHPIRRLITAYKNYHLQRASRRRLLAENFISQPAVFWRHSVMTEVGFFDESEYFVMDYEYWLRLWQKYEPMFLDRYLASFRWHEVSKSGVGFTRQFSDELRVAERYANGERLPILLHRFNYCKIVTIYTLLAWFRKMTCRCGR